MTMIIFQLIKIVNSGNIGLENGNLVFGDLGFVANGKVES